MSKLSQKLRNELTDFIVSEYGDRRDALVDDIAATVHDLDTGFFIGDQDAVRRFGLRVKDDTGFPMLSWLTSHGLYDPFDNMDDPF